MPSAFAGALAGSAPTAGAWCGPARCDEPSVDGLLRSIDMEILPNDGDEA